MTDLKTRLSFNIPSAFKYIKGIRDMIDSAAQQYDLSKKDIYQIKLIIEEVISNIIDHAYNKLEDRDLQIDIQIDQEKIVFTTVDRGRFFDPSKMEEIDLKEHRKDRKKRGLGWYIIKKNVDEMKYMRDDKGRNILILVKKYKKSE